MCHKPSAKGGTCRSCSIYVVDVVKQEEEKMKNQFFSPGVWAGEGVALCRHSFGATEPVHSASGGWGRPMSV